MMTIMHTYLLNKQYCVIGMSEIEQQRSMQQQTEKNRLVISKNWAPFIDCINEINNAQLENTKYLDEKMKMYNLFDYHDNYSKI